jgi:very-short-patch-repair endonuclease
MSTQGLRRMVASRATALGRTTSLAEQQARELLDVLGLTYRTQVPIGSWVIDLVVDSPTLAIEVHGAYWHDLPAAVQRDVRKRATLTAMGYTVLFLRTDEMHLWWQQLAPFASSSGPLA